jgi:hypothetical protein
MTMLKSAFVYLVIGVFSVLLFVSVFQAQSASKTAETKLRVIERSLSATLQQLQQLKTLPTDTKNELEGVKSAVVDKMDEVTRALTLLKGRDSAAPSPLSTATSFDESCAASEDDIVGCFSLVSVAYLHCSLPKTRRNFLR